MTIAEKLHREGRDEGKRVIVRKQLTLKFGALPAHVDARLEAATAEELERFAERVLTADTLDAVLAR